MAPSSLTSNSFLLTTTPHSRLTLNHPRLTVFAKKSGGSFPSFQIGKPKDNDSDVDGTDESVKPFRFNFGNVSDFKSLIPIVSNPSGLNFGNLRRKDPGTVFVAGATGLVGIRIAQTLLREGFSVRAGVSELDVAQELALLASKYKIISTEESKRFNAVESTFQDTESIARAIGNASKVVVTIGLAEDGPTTQVSTSDALQVVQAAQLAGVDHVAIIYDGNVTTASTNNVIDGITSFFNNLFSKSQSLTVNEFLQEVTKTDVSYTFIKTSLTEDFAPESSYNVVVLAEGSVSPNDYKVGKSKIASLVANVFSNTAVAENKVVEVFTDPSAPLKSADELFSVIPEDGRRKAYAESLAKKKAEEETRIAAEEAREASETEKKQLKAEVKKATNQKATEKAEENPEAPGDSVESFFNKAKDISNGLSWEKLSSQISSAVQTTNIQKPKVQVATVRGQAKAKTLPSKKAFVKQSRVSSLKTKEEEGKVKGKPTEVRNVFGGLFKQETIYVDDD